MNEIVHFCSNARHTTHTENPKKPWSHFWFCSSAVRFLSKRSVFSVINTGLKRNSC